MPELCSQSQVRALDTCLTPGGGHWTPVPERAEQVRVPPATLQEVRPPGAAVPHQRQVEAAGTGAEVLPAFSPASGASSSYWADR